jgi:hypothetical protein
MKKEEAKWWTQKLYNKHAFQKNYDENGINLLAHLIAIRQHDIQFHPEWASEASLRKWLDDQIVKYPQIYSDWSIEYGDYDNNKDTPDTVLLKDGKGQIIAVDGYSLGSGEKLRRRKMVYEMFPDEVDRKAFYSNETESKLRTLVYKWFATPYEERESKYHDNFGEFARAYTAKHQKFMNVPEYRTIHQYVCKVLKIYDAKSVVKEGYTRSYIGCIAKVASFYNELLKAGKIDLQKFLDETNDGQQREIIYVFAVMYENVTNQNEPIARRRFLPLQGLKEFLNPPAVSLSSSS